MLDVSKISKLVKDNNFTQEIFCEKIGISTVAYQKAMKRKDFKASTLSKIADIFKINESYFFESEKKFQKSEQNLAEEPTNVYQTNQSNNYYDLALRKLDKIIELLEKK